MSITLSIPIAGRSTPGSLLPVPSPFPRHLLRLLPLGHRVILHRQGRQCRRWTRKKEGKSEGRVCLRRVCFYPVPLETLQCFAGLRGEQVSQYRSNSPVPETILLFSSLAREIVLLEAELRSDGSPKNPRGPFERAELRD